MSKTNVKVVLVNGKKVDAVALKAVLDANPGAIPLFIDNGKAAASKVVTEMNYKGRYTTFRGVNRTTHEDRLAMIKDKVDIVATFEKTPEVKAKAKATVKATVTPKVTYKAGDIIASFERPFGQPRTYFYKVTKATPKGLKALRVKSNDVEKELKVYDKYHWKHTYTVTPTFEAIQTTKETIFHLADNGEYWHKDGWGAHRFAEAYDANKEYTDVVECNLWD